ncbi:hypothetical protein O3P69_016594 [Scylla paramamosain]|uniref:Uncharacterized protein n=1 Tax=Scylla paramamosain TaxID=85552 RepID=A0AAW0SY44_SCYPA
MLACTFTLTAEPLTRPERVGCHLREEPELWEELLVAGDIKSEKKRRNASLLVESLASTGRMKPPPLLLLLLVAGFVSCIPQGRHEGGGAEDSLVPQSGVGSSGSSKNLSDDETSPLLEKQTKSREKRQPGRRGGSDSDSSNSDNANEETPLLRSSRNTTEKKRYEDDTGSRRTTDKQILPKTKQKIYPHDRYQKLRQRDSGGSGSDDRGQEINKRIFFFSSKNKPKKRKTAKSGLRKKFSGFKSWVKKKIHNDPPYQRFHDSEGYDDDGYYEDTEGHDIVERGMRSIKNWFKNKTAMLSARRDSNKTDDGGRDNNGYDGRDEMYDNDDDYNDETMLLPAKKWRRLRAFFTRYRNKRGNLDLLERVLRNFALASSRLEEEVTPTTSPPPLLKNKIEKDVNGGNEDEDDKVSKYEEGDSEDEGIGRDYYNDG